MRAEECVAEMKIMSFNGRFFSFAVVVCILLLAPHCQYFVAPDTKIEMDGKIPPSFTFVGNGHVSSIAVIDVSANDLSMYAPERAMWEIVPTSETRPDGFPKITYGIVPPGFEQRWPVNASPRALQPETPYRITAPTLNARPGKLIFLIRNGQTLRVIETHNQEYYVETPTP